MASSGEEIEFVEQLKEAGNLLLSPPSDIQDLIALLDKVESLLAMVEQSPSKSVGAALLPSMTALVANKVLRHQDTSVRMAVASCMSEITRISAPDAPYNDEEMREIFKLIVSAFEKLSDVLGRFYAKAVNCLDILTKVRTSLVMLDLECDASIVEMFQIFLKVIRLEHPKAIFSAMEKTMTLVIDESEDVSWDLLSTLLASVRRENQDVSSTSWKLGEEVIANCAAKLKPYLMEAVQSRGIVLDEYADVVLNICKNGDGTLQHGHRNDTEEHMVTKEPDSAFTGEVYHDVDGISKSTMNDGTAPTRNEDSFINDKSSKVLERCSLSEDPKTTDEREQPKNTDAREPPKSTDTGGCAEPDTMRTVESGVEQESVTRKRGRKPNSLMNPEEGYDHSWISTGRKTRVVRKRRKSLNKGVDQTPSGNLGSKTSSILSKLKMGGEPASSASPKSSRPDASNSKRGRAKRAPQSENVGVKKEAEDDGNSEIKRRKRSAAQYGGNSEIKRRKRSAAQYGGNSEIKRRKRSATQYSDLNLEKEPEERRNSETKQGKHSTKDGVSVETSEEATLPGCKVLEKEDEILGDLKRRSKKKSDIKARRSVNDDRSSKQTIFKKVSSVPAASDKGIAEASNDEKKMISKAAAKSEETPQREVKRKRSAGKDMKLTSKAAVESSNKDGNSSGETPKTEVKRKNTAEKEVASETSAVDEQLVGSRVRVWWPLDKKFYEGAVDSYDNIKKKHKIVYADGEVELLNLKRQRWELIGLAEEGQETDVVKPDASSNTLQKQEVDKKFEPAKEVKRKSSSRRKFSATQSKAKTRKSGDTSADGAKLDKPNFVDEPMNNLSVKDGKSKEDYENSTGDQMESDIKFEEIEPAKEVKRKSSSRRKSHASRSKARKSGGNSADGAKLDKRNFVDEPVNDLSVKDGKSKDDENSTGVQMADDKSKEDDENSTGDRMADGKSKEDDENSTGDQMADGKSKEFKEDDENSTGDQMVNGKSKEDDENSTGDRMADGKSKEDDENSTGDRMDSTGDQMADGKSKEDNENSTGDQNANGKSKEEDENSTADQIADGKSKEDDENSTGFQMSDGKPKEEDENSIGDQRADGKSKEEDENSTGDQMADGKSKEDGENSTGDQMADGKSKEDDENSIGDRMETDIDFEQTAKETAIKSEGKSSKVGSESGGEC